MITLRRAHLSFTGGGVDRTASTIETLSFLFSYYAVPVAIGMLSLLVLLNPGAPADVPVGTPVALRVLADPAGRLDASTAAAALKRTRPIDQYDTRLSETPFWFAANVPTHLAGATQPPADGSPASRVVLRFPSRHIQQIACYDGTSLEPLGQVSDQRAISGNLERSGNGVSLMLGQRTEALCRAVFSGPAAISATYLSDTEQKVTNDTFYRRAGLLEGGLATLAVFVLVAAFINRDWVYVLFAAWLFGNLRLGAISMGWDTLWLGSPIPHGWVSLVRKITVPVYYILTCTLFATLFRHDLPRIGYQRLFRAVLGLGFVLLAASIALPVPMYLPLMWVTASFAIGVVVFMLGRLLIYAPSRTAMWYGAALAVTLLASLSEVATAAFKTRILIHGLNNVTAALISSLMAAFAIAEQIRSERQQRARMQAELNRTYALTPVGLFTLNADGSFARFNPALQVMLGMRASDAHHHWDEYFTPGSWKPLYDQAMASGDAVERELARDATPPGGEATDDDPSEAAGATRYHYLVRAAHAGTQLEGSIQDVTERQRAVQTLRYLAEHDPLTGALNRRGIEREMHDITEQAVLTGEQRIIGYLDLDRFKLINDLYGHHIGDEVLRQVRQRMEGELAPADRIGRIGGDEFVILFGASPLEDAAMVAQKMVETIGGVPYRIGKRAFQVRASAGVIESPPGLRAEEAISMADAACRDAKRNGNGRVVTYRSNATIFGERARDLSLIETFSGDLPSEGFFLAMQPIMSMEAPYDALDFEVLLRMRAPDGSTIPPTRVIAAAEANGTISALDQWVIRTILEWIDCHRAKLTRTRFISVNVSGASLNDEHFVSEIGALFRRYRHVVPMLCIEITEGVALHDLDNTRRLIDSLQRLGARVALDDFGSGYTSFPYLRDLPADALKIDGGFVRDIHHLSANAAIVEAAIGLARNLGMQSIAEWVEDAATLEVLQSMRVDFVQGFGIARPQSPETILAATSAADFIEDPAILALIGKREFHRSDDDGPPDRLH
ncbi:EAL domain-containing protein [Burkholderia sp. Bp8963]|uniref:EAL domain-containing protein n=1 Tax=Burkholderia sp. Bp8963 TaxID=2184547 RepID=UPI00163A7123|nr:EAL domain-containing protein [Burkholderia sp. Bp8963]